MSFPTFKFEEIVKEEWEESELFNMFNTTKFMFAVFKEYDGEFHFEKIKFWNMPMEILEKEVKKVWKRTVDVINQGNIVKEIKNGNRITNFPGMSENDYCHVRPHLSKNKVLFSYIHSSYLNIMNKFVAILFYKLMPHQIL